MEPAFLKRGIDVFGRAHGLSRTIAPRDKLNVKIR